MNAQPIDFVHLTEIHACAIIQHRLTKQEFNVNIQDINRAIISGVFTNDDLNSVIDAVKFARARITRQNKASLMLGDTVQFTSTRTGQNMQGTVQKIAIKFVTVKTPSQGLWKVPASMLTAI